MSFETSKKTFPIAMLDYPAAKRVLEKWPSVIFVYDEGDKVFRVRARNFEYQGAMKDIGQALKSFETSISQKYQS